MSATLSPLKKYTTLLRRELLEHRTSFITVPVIISGLMVALLLLTLLNGQFGSFGEADEKITFTFADALNRAADRLSGPQKQAAVAFFFSGFTSLIWMIFPFVVFFTLLGSLYEERRDRSFLFWKSLPVSDWEEVLTRLFGATWVPFITYSIISVIAALVMLILASLVALIQGGAVGVLWNVGSSISFALESLPISLIYFFWLLPLLAWVMFASAVAPKAPLMIAVVPPAVIILVEGIVFKSWTIAKTLGAHISPISGSFGAGNDLSIVINSDAFEDGMKENPLLIIDEIFDAFYATLADPQLYIGIVVGVGLLAAAVYRRRFTS